MHTHARAQGNRNKIVNRVYEVGSSTDQGFSITLYPPGTPTQKAGTQPMGQIRFHAPFRAEYGERNVALCCGLSRYGPVLVGCRSLSVLNCDEFSAVCGAA